MIGLVINKPEEDPADLIHNKQVTGLLVHDAQVNHKVVIVSTVFCFWSERSACDQLGKLR